jgi:hypothetical protein
MKLLIVSTPKTGNTWLKNLLSAIYDLPMVSVAEHFDAAEFDALGDQWVCHQHFHPTADLLEWTRKNGVILLTTIRHPADSFVSVFHYAHGFESDDRLKDAIAKDNDQFGENVAHYVARVYPLMVNLSVAWIRTGRAHVVRYEDLWADPVGVLMDLTNKIAAVSRETVEHAVASCDIKVMRAKAEGTEKNFFRKGGSGGWREALPPRIAHIFAYDQPYVRQFQAMGYSMRDVERSDKPDHHRSPQPVCSNNGEAVTTDLPNLPYVRDWFREFSGGHEPDSAAGAPQVAAFNEWLAEPSAEAPGYPELTNLAVKLHQSRSDLAENFPALTGNARIDYLHWFVRHAQTEYGLDERYMEAARESFRLWAAAVPGNGTSLDNTPLCNLARHVYESAPHLADNFPVLTGQSGSCYLLWFWAYAQREFAFDPELLRRLSASFQPWAIQLANPNAQPNEIALSNLLAAIYDSRPDVQALYPKRVGENPVEFVRWFFRSAESAYGLDASLIADFKDRYVNWANRPADADPSLGKAAPLITNLGAHLHAVHPDREQTFPDLYGTHRIDFGIWFIHWVNFHEPYGWEFVLPVLMSWADGISGPADSHARPSALAETVRA